MKEEIKLTQVPLTPRLSNSSSELEEIEDNVPAEPKKVPEYMHAWVEVFGNPFEKNRKEEINQL